MYSHPIAAWFPSLTNIECCVCVCGLQVWSAIRHDDDEVLYERNEGVLIESIMEEAYSEFLKSVCAGPERNLLRAVLSQDEVFVRKYPLLRDASSSAAQLPSLSDFVANDPVSPPSGSKRGSAAADAHDPSA